jgi:hypothetical protein
MDKLLVVLLVFIIGYISYSMLDKLSSVRPNVYKIVLDINK